MEFNATLSFELLYYWYYLNEIRGNVLPLPTPCVRVYLPSRSLVESINGFGAVSRWNPMLASA
jgi:hypothetical protein